MDQARYATSSVTKYLDTDTVNASTKFYNKNLPSDMILTKSYKSTIDEQVDKLTKKFIIHYIDCIGTLIY